MINFPIDSDATVNITGLRDAQGAYANNATVTGRLYQGATPLGVPMTFVYVPGSNGDYVATVPPQHLRPETFYMLVITATSGGKQLQVRCKARALYASPVT
jgi:hypothetical protein